MIKTLLEDLLLYVILGIALYLVYKKWIAGWITTGAAAVEKTVAAYKEDISTIQTAITSPSSVVDDLFNMATPYISQADQAAAIAKIKGKVQKGV